MQPSEAVHRGRNAVASIARRSEERRLRARAPAASASTRAPRGVVIALAALLAAACGACGAKKPPPPAEPAVTEVTTDAAPPEPPPQDAGVDAPRSLYDRLGGREGVAAVVDSLAKNVAADPRVSKYFKKSKDGLERFKQQMADQICALAGGGCTYAGKSMKDAHKGMGITESQFDAVVEDLKRALDERGVNESDASELFAAIAPMRDDIVEKKGKKK